MKIAFLLGLTLWLPLAGGMLAAQAKPAARAPISAPSDPKAQAAKKAKATSAKSDSSPFGSAARRKLLEQRKALNKPAAAKKAQPKKPPAKRS